MIVCYGEWVDERGLVVMRWSGARPNIESSELQASATAPRRRVKVNGIMPQARDAPTLPT